MRKRVLVTGGAGFIGSHTAKALAVAGYEPVVFDNLHRGHHSLVRFGSLVEGDIQDRSLLQRAIGECRPIACMHFAALAYVAESIEYPDLYYLNNVAGSLNLLRALRDSGVDKVVFSSSCAVYGEPDSEHISESAVKSPISPYGRSKLMVENMLSDFDSAFGLRSVSLRYFNAAGADPEGIIGEIHDPEPHLIPRALMAAAGHIGGIRVNGTDYPTRDGTAIRDYTHVSDLAEAHVRALDYLLDGGPTDAFNIGTGRGFSVHEIIRSVARVTGRHISVEVGPRRVGDPAQVLADPRKAQQVLGFAATYTDIDVAVSHAWKWYTDHGFAHR